MHSTIGVVGLKRNSLQTSKGVFRSSEREIATSIWARNRPELWERLKRGLELTITTRTCKCSAASEKELFLEGPSTASENPCLRIPCHDWEMLSFPHFYSREVDRCTQSAHKVTPQPVSRDSEWAPPGNSRLDQPAAFYHLPPGWGAHSLDTATPHHFLGFKARP